MGRKAALIRSDEGNPDSPKTLEEECIHDQRAQPGGCSMQTTLSRSDTPKLVRFLA
jgi:hypothetical protein